MESLEKLNMTLHLIYFKIFARILKVPKHINKIKKFYNSCLKLIMTMKKYYFYIKEKVHKFMNYKVPKTTSEIL